jgi:hypothetical protein
MSQYGESRHVARTEIDRQVNSQFVINELLGPEPARWFSWRIYITNYLPEMLTFEPIVLPREIYGAKYGRW